LIPRLSAVEIINENLGGLKVSVQELVEAFVVGRHDAFLNLGRSLRLAGFSGFP